MKKIEKEEQLKKKLEQTMEEKMAADSKTVEGDSAVVKAERNVRALAAAPSEGRTRGRGRQPDRKNTGDPPPDRGEKGGTRKTGGETEEDCEESENNKTLGTDGKGGWCCVGCGGVRFWSEYDERGESDSVGGDGA